MPTPPKAETEMGQLILFFSQKYKGKRKILVNSTRPTSPPVNPEFSPATVEDVTTVDDATVTNVVTMTDNTIETVQGRNKGFEVDKAENVGVEYIGRMLE